MIVQCSCKCGLSLSGKHKLTSGTPLLPRVSVLAESRVMTSLLHVTPFTVNQADTVRATTLSCYKQDPALLVAATRCNTDSGEINSNHPQQRWGCFFSGKHESDVTALHHGNYKNSNSADRR